jgi:ABC-type spermidine/putrescine transport system permease subunit I
MDRPDWRIGAAIAVITILIVLGAFALLLAHVNETSRHEARTMLTTTT